MARPISRDFARACCAAIALAALPGAQAQPAADRWTFAVSPYLWLPNVDGTLKYNAPPGASGRPEVSAGPNDYLENLDFALMLAGEARKGKWSIFTDAVYLDFGKEKSAVRSVDFGGSVIGTNLNTSTQTSLKGLQWTLAAGYTAVQTSAVMLDVIAGFRYLGVEVTTDWQLTAAVSGPGAGQTFPASGSVSESPDIWDAIVGVRGRVRLGESPWFVPYHLDVGTGSSSITWQGLAGIAYAFKWGDAVLAYRHLFYDQSDDKLFQDFSFSGPALGVSFRF